MIVFEEKKEQGRDLLWGKISDETSTADGCCSFFHLMCCAKHRKDCKREPGLIKEEFRFKERLRLCCLTYCYWRSCCKNYKVSSKWLNKGTFEDKGDGLVAKGRKVLEEQKVYYLQIAYMKRRFILLLLMSRPKKVCRIFMQRWKMVNKQTVFIPFC